MDNPIPISSNITESQGNDPNVFHSSENAPLNSIVSTHGNAPSTSSAFRTNSIDGNAPNTSNNGNAPNNNGNAPLPHLKFFVTLPKRNSENLKKREKTKTRKNIYLDFLSNRFSLQIICKLSSSNFITHFFDLISEGS